MKQNSQVNDVIKHLKTYGSITSLEAVEYYGILRLSGIIYRLRNEFDMEIIKGAGLKTTTPVVITNSNDYTRIEARPKCSINAGDSVLKTVK